MENFLKKLKNSIENGQIDSDVVKEHYKIINGADQLQMFQGQNRDELNVYNKAIDDFVQDGGKSTTTLMDRIALEPKIINEEVQKREIDEFMKQQQKKDMILMNKAQIELLTLENKELNNKIAKNIEYIKYLQEEIDRQ